METLDVATSLTKFLERTGIEDINRKTDGQIDTWNDRLANYHHAETPYVMGN